MNTQQCELCGEEFSYEAHAVEQQLNCPSCGRLATVPASNDLSVNLVEAFNLEGSQFNAGSLLLAVLITCLVSSLHVFSGGILALFVAIYACFQMFKPNVFSGVLQKNARTASCFRYNILVVVLLLLAFFFSCLDVSLASALFLALAALVSYVLTWVQPYYEELSGQLGVRQYPRTFKDWLRPFFLHVRLKLDGDEDLKMEANSERQLVQKKKLDASEEELAEQVQQRFDEWLQSETIRLRGE